MAKLANAADLKSAGTYVPCGFDPHSRHQSESETSAILESRSIESRASTADRAADIARPLEPLPSQGRALPSGCGIADLTAAGALTQPATRRGSRSRVAYLKASRRRLSPEVPRRRPVPPPSRQ